MRNAKILQCSGNAAQLAGTSYADVVRYVGSTLGQLLLLLQFSLLLGPLTTTVPLNNRQTLMHIPEVSILFGVTVIKSNIRNHNKINIFCAVVFTEQNMHFMSYRCNFHIHGSWRFAKVKGHWKSDQRRHNTIIILKSQDEEDSTALLIMHFSDLSSLKQNFCKQISKNHLQFYILYLTDSWIPWGRIWMAKRPPGEAN